MKYRKGERDWHETIFGAVIIIFVVLAFVLIFFTAVSSCRAGIKSADVDAKYEKYLGLLRARGSQAMIWVLDPKNPNGEPIVVGLGVVRYDGTVIAARHIFDNFLEKSLVYLAVPAYFYWERPENINKDMAMLIESINLYKFVSLLVLSEKSNESGRMRGIIFHSENRHPGDNIFVLGDRNNAEAMEYIGGKIVSQDNKNLIIELSTSNSSLIDRQIALGATVWDAKGNFIGFLLQRIGTTNKVRLVFF